MRHTANSGPLQSDYLELAELNDEEELVEDEFNEFCSEWVSFLLRNPVSFSPAVSCCNLFSIPSARACCCSAFCSA